MITEVQATIQATATVESLKNPIDSFAVLDREYKAIKKAWENSKDLLLVNFGLGEFRGEKYGLEIKAITVKGSIDMDALCAKFGITEADLESFRKESTTRTTFKPTI